MAQVEFNYPVKAVNGKVDDGKKLSFRTRYGKTHPYHYRTTTYTPNSEEQNAHRLRFSEARKMAFAQLKDPEIRAKWEKKFAKQRKYVRLDCYVTAELMKTNH